MQADADPWPEHFPAGCPAASTPPAGGVVFRFVTTDPPSRDDMLSWLELGRSSGSDCRRAALSCHTDLTHAREVMDLLPRFKGQLIARANLTPEHGAMDQTGKDRYHVSLWLRRRWLEQAPQLFKVVP